MPRSVDSHRLRLTSADGSSGALLGAECHDCGVKVFGPATFCQACTSSNLSEVVFGTKGTLFSFTVVRVPPAGWPGPVPYILGEIELAEGPHVLAEVIDATQGDLSIGMKVELVLQRVPESPESTDEVVVYKWRPAKNSRKSRQ